MTFDQFHLLILKNQVGDEVRWQEDKDHPELKGNNYLLLKNEWNHSKRQKELFQSLRMFGLKTKQSPLLEERISGYFQLFIQGWRILIEKMVFLGDALPHSMRY